MSDTFLEMRSITKSFPGVRALDAVSMAVPRGEVRALLGENGAGKSTFIKILSGAYQADQGEIWLRGNKIEYRRPIDALERGVVAIYQEFNLVPQLSVAENIMLGQAPSKWGSIDSAEMHRQTNQVLQQLGVQLDTEMTVGELNVAQQQIVEIAKALVRDLRILIMDEPTAALNDAEIDALFNVIRMLKSQGVTILYISHRLNEIYEIADSVTVLKDGKLVDTKPIGEVTRDDLVRLMIGRQLSDYYPPKDTATDEVALGVRNLNLDGVLYDINLEVRRGEILGVAGLEGQGQRELVRAIAGAVNCDSGEIYRNGRMVRIESPSDAMQAGIGFIPDDRKGEGLVLVRSAGENMTLASLKERLKGLFFLDKKRERNFVNELVEAIDIKLTSPSQTVANLSGGNQQKVVVAKCLGTKPKILIVAEPTRGIDVGSKSEIHHIMRNLAREGVGVLMVSSELPEVLGMSDRIVVISGGRIVAEVPGEIATEEVIMAAATKDKVTEAPPN